MNDEPQDGQTSDNDEKDGTKHSKDDVPSLETKVDGVGIVGKVLLPTSQGRFDVSVTYYKEGKGLNAAQYQGPLRGSYTANLYNSLGKRLSEWGRQNPP